MNSSGVRPLARMRLRKSSFGHFTMIGNRERGDVAIFNKDYVTSTLPSDTPAICFKNLHDLSTT
jgi:hypothetical protein